MCRYRSPFRRARGRGICPQTVDDRSLKVSGNSDVSALSGVVSSVEHVYDDDMPTTPTAPQVCDLSGASLGEVASFMAAAAARLGMLVEQGLHLSLIHI